MRSDDRPVRSCLRGSRKKDDSRPQRSTGPLRFGATCVVYYFNNDEQVNVLVESRSDLIVGRRIRLQSEPAVPVAVDSPTDAPSPGAAEGDASTASTAASAATTAATAGEPSPLQGRKPIQRRVPVDARSPPPPLFLAQPLPVPPASAAAVDDDAATTALPLPAPKPSTPRPDATFPLDESDGSDNNSDDDSPPPVATPKKSNAVDIAVGSRSPRAHAIAADVAASAPSRFADTSDWLLTRPAGMNPSTVGLAEHRKDGSLSSPRALSPRPSSPTSASSSSGSGSKAQAEIDAVLAVVDDHEARRQRRGN